MGNTYATFVREKIDNRKLSEADLWNVVVNRHDQFRVALTLSKADIQVLESTPEFSNGFMEMTVQGKTFVFNAIHVVRDSDEFDLIMVRSTDADLNHTYGSGTGLFYGVGEAWHIRIIQAIHEAGTESPTT